MTDDRIDLPGTIVVLTGDVTDDARTCRFSGVLVSERSARRSRPRRGGRVYLSDGVSFEEMVEIKLTLNPTRNATCIALSPLTPECSRCCDGVCVCTTVLASVHLFI